jgi:phosphoglycolate phosphatase
MVRLVLFDIDGTLIQSGGAGEKAFACVCESEFGVPNGAANLCFAGRTDPAIVRDFFKEHQIEPSAPNFQRFFHRYLSHLEDLLKRTIGCVLPGVHDWIQALETATRPPVVGLLTGNIRTGAQLKLSHYQLWHCFRTGAFGDDHEDRNHIAVIARDRGNELLKETLSGDEILVIGDTPRDIECAKAIGARSLAVATGRYSVADLNKCSPTWAVETLQKLSPADACGDQ